MKRTLIVCCLGLLSAASACLAQTTTTMPRRTPFVKPFTRPRGISDEEWAQLQKFAPKNKIATPNRLATLDENLSPLPFIGLPLIPSSVPPGSDEFVLTVNGSQFVEGSTVNWGHTALVTTFVSAARLTAIVPAPNVAAAGTALVTVSNPAPGGGVSDPVPLTIRKASPSVTFANSTIDVGMSPSGIVVADFNNDGIADLAVVNQYDADPTCPVSYRGTVSILLGNGDGTFFTKSKLCAPDRGIFAPLALMTVTPGDFNGDGILDLVVTIDDFLVPFDFGVFLGSGDGTFTFSARYGGWDAVGPIVTGDFDRDGKRDLAMSIDLLGIPSIQTWAGAGDGSFAFEGGGQVCALTGKPIVVGDFNRDGILDLADSSIGPTYGGCSTVYLGNGDGTLMPASPEPSSSGLLTGDFDGDGIADLAGSGYFMKGNGDGTFADMGPGPDLTSVYQIRGPVPGVAVDLNGDSRLDIAAAGPNNNLLLYLGNGNGTFQAPINVNVGQSPQAVAVGDFNGDGLLDLAVTNSADNTISILLQSPAVTVALESSVNPSNFGQAVTLTAAVTAPPGFNQGKPTGTVNFFDTATATNLGMSSLNSSGVASLQFSTLGPSTHTITATYSGDAHFASNVSPVLSQVVLGAAAKFSPTSLSFGNQTVAISSSPQSITLKNTGDIPLTFNSITFTGTNPTNFTQTNNCGTSLAGGATCTFSVTFAPSATGPRSAALTLSDNAPSKLQKVPVTGVGVLPAVTFSPTSLTFPTQVIYTTSKAQTVTLTNAGPGFLNISNITASAQFSQTNNCGSTVAPAGTCTLTVKFQPTGLDAITGSISINDNAPASPQALHLTGVATAIQLTPVGVSFGNQPVGTKSLAKTVTVSNKSHQTININRIAIRGADPSDFPFISTTCGASLSSGASCFIKVAFMPAVTGKRTATVAVSDDGGGDVQRVGLAGTGT